MNKNKQLTRFSLLLSVSLAVMGSATASNFQCPSAGSVLAAWKNNTPNVIAPESNLSNWKIADLDDNQPPSNPEISFLHAEVVYKPGAFIPSWGHDNFTILCVYKDNAVSVEQKLHVGLDSTKAPFQGVSGPWQTKVDTGECYASTASTCTFTTQDTPKKYIEWDAKAPAVKYDSNKHEASFHIVSKATVMQDDKSSKDPIAYQCNITGDATCRADSDKGAGYFIASGSDLVGQQVSVTASDKIDDSVTSVTSLHATIVGNKHIVWQKDAPVVTYDSESQQALVHVTPDATIVQDGTTSKDHIDYQCNITGDATATCVSVDPSKNTGDFIASGENLIGRSVSVTASDQDDTAVSKVTSDKATISDQHKQVMLKLQATTQLGHTHTFSVSCTDSAGTKHGVALPSGAANGTKVKLDMPDLTAGSISCSIKDAKEGDTVLGNYTADVSDLKNQSAKSLGEGNYHYSVATYLGKEGEKRLSFYIWH